MLGDRYRLDDRIAAGGMGEVWKATDTVLGRDVAVKTLHAERAGDAGFQSRFRHEARAMAVLHHPGVADVYDFGQTGDGVDAYIVMARVDGEALNQRIADRGRLTAAETMSIVAQAGHALEAAHQAGIVHRDVKPGNLIIKPDGTVVLVDFGVARTAESASAALTGAKEVVGTALYIAPEQVSKDARTGPLADVYALGVVAYHCLAGHPPFMADNPLAVAMQHLQDEAPPLPEDVPEPVRALVARAMQKDPADRFESAAAMAAAAEQASASGQTTAILAAPAILRTAPRSGDTSVMPAVLPVAPPPPPGRPRRPLLVAGVAAALVLALAGAVLAFVSPGWLLPEEDAAPTMSVPGASAGASKVAPAPQGGDNDDQTRAPRTRATSGAPAQGGDPTPSPTPSRSTAPQEPDPTEPAETEPAETGAPTPTSDEGDNSGPGSGGETGEDNSGSGGGNPEAEGPTAQP
jgi:serine/threonine-protein kinase